LKRVSIFGQEKIIGFSWTSIPSHFGILKSNDSLMAIELGNVAGEEVSVVGVETGAELVGIAC
jgi:hypothetical protein